MTDLRELVANAMGQRSAIDVSHIVLNCVLSNDEATIGYNTDPAMRLGVQVVIGALSNVARVCQARGDDLTAINDLIQAAADLCSRSGGQADPAVIIAAANSTPLLSTWPLEHP